MMTRLCATAFLLLFISYSNVSYAQLDSSLSKYIHTGEPTSYIKVAISYCKGKIKSDSLLKPGDTIPGIIIHNSESFITGYVIDSAAVFGQDTGIAYFNLDDKGKISYYTFKVKDFRGLDWGFIYRDQLGEPIVLWYGDGEATLLWQVKLKDREPFFALWTSDRLSGSTLRAGINFP